MANWSNTVVTQLGLNLQAKLQAGKQIKFTRAVSGSHYVSPDILLQQTDILEQKQTLLLSDVVPKDTGKAILPVSLSNHGLAASYTQWQVGVFADDPDLGEILYLIAQAVNPDVIPTETSMPDFFIDYSFDLIFGNADSFDVYLDSTALATKGDIVNAPMKDVLVDADAVVLTDSADSNKIRRTTWTTIKAALKTTFDNVYASIAKVYTKAEVDTAIDTLSEALSEHGSNGTIHITTEERTAWNAKETPAGAQAKADAAKAAAIAAIPGSLPANGGSADYATSAGTANYANSAGSAPANGGNANYANSSGASNSCNGLTFSVEASPPGTVTNNRITFSYG